MDDQTTRLRIGLNRRRLLSALGTTAAAGGAALWPMTRSGIAARQEETPGGDTGHAAHAEQDRMGTPTPAATPDAAQTPMTDPIAFGFVAGEDLVEPEERRSENGVLETTLKASLGRTVVAGLEVTALVYDGAFPGPTLRVASGDTLRIGLQNELPDATNLHTHGFHVSPRDNGDNVFVTVEPGTAFGYEYRIPTTRPGRTGTTRTCTA